MDVAKDLFFSHQALAVLFSTANKLQMQGDKYLQDLTIRQMLIVPVIIHAPEGGATLNYIARKLGTSKQSAKHIVDALVKKKYLTVTANERDKRAVNVTITPEGKRAFDFCSVRTDEFLADIFHDFTTEELEMLWTLLMKLYSFDGIGQETDNYEAHMAHHAGGACQAADQMLQHHQHYIKRRNHTFE